MRVTSSILLLCVPIFCFSQRPDSLRSIWNDATVPDTIRAKALYDLIWNVYLQSAPDSALTLAGDLEHFARKAGAKKWEADALHTEGVALYYMGQYDQALGFYHRSLAIRRAINDKDGIARSLNNIGNIQKEQGENAAALENYEECERLWDGMGDKAGVAGALNNIAVILSAQGDYVGSLKKHLESLALKEEVHDSLGMTSSLNNIGTIYHTQGQYLRSIEWYERSLKINELIGRKSGVALVLSNLGTLYSSLGDRARAMDHFQRSLAISESIGDQANTASTLFNIGLAYADLGDHGRAMEKYNAALEIWRQMGDKGGVASALESIGSLLMEEGKVTEAQANYEQSLALFEETGDPAAIAGPLDNLGQLFAHEGRFEQALSYHERSRHLRESVGDRSGLSQTLSNIGGIHEQLGHHQQAVTYGRKALELAQEIGNVSNTTSASLLLYQALKATGQEKEALRMHELYIAMRDSVENKAEQEKVIRLEARYDYEKKALADSLRHANELARIDNERALERLRADRNRDRALTFGGGAVLLMSGGVAFFLSDRRRRQARFEKDAAQLETQALRSQMNPHFIFNALNSIGAFVQGNEPDRATSYLTRFARLMRLVLENSRQAEVPLKDDLEALEAYLHLERMRGGEKFDYAIHVDPSIDQEGVLVPPLVIQPFVENAIWHGMAGKEGKGYITLSVTRRGEDLVMSIEDDGVGRHVKKQEPPAGVPIKRTSLATTITQARLDLVQKQKGRPAGFTYIDLPQGTKVEVSLPITGPD